MPNKANAADAKSRAADLQRWLEKIMPSIVSNNDAEQCLREILKSEGYELSPERGFGETGVDVIASRFEDVFHIEAENGDGRIIVDTQC